MDRPHVDHPEPPSGHEPGLGGARPDLSGYEPLLGGSRRIGADASRVLALVDSAAEADWRRLLRHIQRLGQTDLYTQELAGIVPGRARRRMGSWHGSFTPGQRCQAMAILAEVGSYESIIPLLEAIQEDLYAVREAASAALAAVFARLDPYDRRTRLAYRALVDSLSIRLLSARKVVARILAGAPPELVLGPLLRGALQAPEWWARREAAWVLGMLGDSRATRRLIEALEDPSEAVRASAAWALGRIDAPVSVPALGAAAQDRDEIVRAAAVEALGAQAARIDEPGPRMQEALSGLIDSLQDVDISVRMAALEALSSLAEEPQARRAIERFRDDRRGRSEVRNAS